MWERFKKDAQQAAGDFSLENIETAFAGFSNNAKGIFAESVYDIFIIQSSWARFYDTNSAFKIEQKMHCSQVFETGKNSGYALFGNMREWSHDLDRIFRVLDGKNAADIRTGFAKQLEAARERGDSKMRICDAIADTKTATCVLSSCGKIYWIGLTRW